MIQRSLKKNPSNIYLANACGIVLYRSGKSADAVEVFKKVRESSLDYDCGCVNLAHLYLLEKRYSDAASLYQLVLSSSKGKKDVQLYLCRALALMRGGEYVHAQEVLESAQKLDPTVGVIRIMNNEWW